MICKGDGLKLKTEIFEYEYQTAILTQTVGIEIWESIINSLKSDTKVKKEEKPTGGHTSANGGGAIFERGEDVFSRLAWKRTASKGSLINHKA